MIGSLFAGYAGLDLAVEATYGGQMVWYSEIDPGACKVLAHRFPAVPNLGDITAVEWTRVEPVNILTGGSPCQDLSTAGRRAGMTGGTRSNLWVAMREAIAQLRPQTVIWENVRGAYSAEATSAVEPCPGCVGDGPGVHLRALGRVLGDLSALGYDTRWHGLRAADIGAPHGRFRVFVIATDASGLRRRARWAPGPGETAGGWSHGDAPGRRLFPTPRATDGTKGGPGQRGSSGDLMLPSAVALLPTPSVADSEGGHERRGGARGDELLLNGVAKAHADGKLLPTPRVKNNENRQSEQFAGEDGNFYGLLHNPERWGNYADAIARWESIIGRTAPEPTQASSKGNPQLSPRFVEWMMGLPEGWVTDAPGITRNEALRMLGNGVVTRQAAHALRLMAGWEAVA